MAQMQSVQSGIINHIAANFQQNQPAGMAPHIGQFSALAAPPMLAKMGSASNFTAPFVVQKNNNGTSRKMEIPSTRRQAIPKNIFAVVKDPEKKKLINPFLSEV